MKLSDSRTNLRRIPPAIAALLLGISLSAQESSPSAPVALPAYTVTAGLVANQEPVGALNMPVSALRFEPRVDLQGRNLAEAQADIAIRGGIFESSGIKLGALSLYDPQTGHYFAEIPVAPAMLDSPLITTGSDNALSGFNATVGSVHFGWRAIEQRGEISAGVGQSGFNRQSFYEALVYPQKVLGGQFAADVEWSRSVSDGAILHGDHNFQRVAGRVQHRTAQTQTDLFAGYQAKFFGWPNLYTPFGVDETENLQTVLVALNHRWTGEAGSQLEFGAYYRRNRDDYEYSRQSPRMFNAYEHTTWVRGASLQGRQQFADFGLNYSVQAMNDGLRSTALTFGPADKRSFLKLALVPEKTLKLAQGALTVRGGLAYDDSNRAKDAISPLARVQWETSSGQQYYFEYSEATQLPTYTALKSNPNAGLFRGNPNLGRETSRNLELGLNTKVAGWKLDAAVFYRWDDDLVDWTYVEPPPGDTKSNPARTANAVDIGTFGLETVAVHRTKNYDLVLGYTYLHKTADYRLVAIDASFYALNSPIHRFTAALTWRLGAGWEIRSDNEYRIQEKNVLRRIGGDNAVISTLGLHYLPPSMRGWEFSILVDNLWDSDFQELPAVPAAPRQVAGSVSLRW